MNMEVVQDLSTTSILYLVISLVLPVVVALVTKANAPSSTKAYVLLALAAVNSFAIEAYDAYNAGAGDDFGWKAAIIGTVVSFLVAAATHAGLLKPAGVTGSTGSAAQVGNN
jgi:hypothetical protein